MQNNVIISAQGVSKLYDLGQQKIKALDNVALDVFKGDLITIQGQSGCGKTTLLNMISLMDKPSSGSVVIYGNNVTELDDDAQASLRAKHIGFVFQFYNLIEHLTDLENVAIAVAAAGEKNDAKRKAKATEVLNRVGLGNRLGNKPDELSGGERQRVAIARALVNNPSIIIADEPTGDLDTETGHEILKLLVELNEKDGNTIIIVTHNPDIGAVGKRKVMMRDGKVISINGVQEPDGNRN